MQRVAPPVKRVSLEGRMDEVAPTASPPIGIANAQEAEDGDAYEKQTAEHRVWILVSQLLRSNEIVSAQETKRQQLRRLRRLPGVDKPLGLFLRSGV